MSDNPFADPGDQDRTVIRPMPGGARRAVRAAADSPPAVAGPDLETIPSSLGPLAHAAAPLLLLLARLRNTSTAPDPGDMRERTRRELRAFERRAREAGVAPDQLRLAHYALCAALDDVVLNTPWGSHGRWRDEPLAAALHQDEKAGQGFFEQIRTLRAALPAALPVLELMFVCLSLGMMGPYRNAPDGPAQLERVRHHVFGLIAKATPAPSPVLSPDMTGIDRPFSPRRGGVPVWVAASAALGLMAAAYVWGLTSLNTASDRFYLAALAAAPSVMPALVRPPATPPPPPPPEPAQSGPADRLRAALADLPAVEVIATRASTIIRIQSRVLFPQPNATLAGGVVLDRVADALRPGSGPIRVIAYTDGTPAAGGTPATGGTVARTVGFPSAFALTTARATAIRAALARKLPDPARIASEGRAGADPIAPNNTAEGRERNRRVDLLLSLDP